MALSNLSSAQLAHLIGLVKEKELLQARLVEVQQLLGNFPNEVGRNSSGARKRGPRRRRAALKDALIKTLQAAGKKGLSVKELAVKLKAKSTSISVWFYTTGKKIKAIKKIGRARFAYSG